MARIATAEDLALAKDRLRGNGAWNGQGLLTFLALTSRNDPSREHMQPLQDLCLRVVNGDEDGLEVELTDEEEAIFDGMAVYSVAFQAAIDAGRAAAAE